MHFQSNLVSLILLAAGVSSCPDHSDHGLRKRATEEQDWAYEASYNWGMIKEEYKLCQTGTQQSPIPLLLTQGLALSARPIFNIPTIAQGGTNGTFYNWGYGPAFNLPPPTPLRPSAIISSGTANETIYLREWHIHSPADHSVQGDRSKAELHLVFSNMAGLVTTVFAIRIDPGTAPSPFFAQLPSPIPSFRETATQIPAVLDMTLALREVNEFREFWTYEGSLTSPPCREGIKWFVARNILYVGHAQMQAILGASTFSARAEQEVWLHGINSR